MAIHWPYKAKTWDPTTWAWEKIWQESMELFWASTHPCRDTPPCAPCKKFMIGICLIECNVMSQKLLLKLWAPFSWQVLTKILSSQSASCAWCRCRVVTFNQKSTTFTKNVGTQEKDQLPAKFYGVPFNRPEAWKDCFCLLLRHRHPQKDSFKNKVVYIWKQFLEALTSSLDGKV